jgi:hypothetical protein
MPNWCHNRVYFGLGDSVENNNKFREYIGIPLTEEDEDVVEDIKFDFNKVLPLPKELTNHGVNIVTQEEYDNWKPNPEHTWIQRPITQKMSDEFKEKFGTDNWYNWCLDNWGTKWNACESYLTSNDEDGIEINFETAWGPASGIFELIEQKIAEEQWDITVSWFYDEPGMMFAGYLPN